MAKGSLMQRDRYLYIVQTGGPGSKENDSAGSART